MDRMIESGRAIEPKETRPSGDLARPPPLILDLDGTLIATDTLAETLLLYLKESPIRVVQALIWLSHGVAHLKRHLAAVVALDIDRLPVRPEALSLALAASADREVYIATAADSDIATAMAARFPCFAGAIGSQGEINLKGSAKAAALTARFPDGFDYVGDSPADLPVWRAARGATYIGPSATLARRLRREKPDAEVVGVARAGPRVWAKALRLHQWSKNLLLFVPLALGG
jgi:phosphoserine phosphatase